MTRYIFAGGYDSSATTEQKKHFAAAIRGNKSGQLKILSCLFSQPLEKRDEWFESRIRYFSGLLGSNAIVELAETQSLIKQIIRSDVIYLHGGDNDLLANELKPLTAQLKKLFKDKTVVGSSAGAHYLSNVYWTCDDRVVKRGSGSVPVSVITHFESQAYDNNQQGVIDWQTAENELKAEAPSGMRMLKIREGDFVLIEQ